MNIYYTNYIGSISTGYSIPNLYFPLCSLFFFHFSCLLKRQDPPMLPFSLIQQDPITLSSS